MKLLSASILLHSMLAAFVGAANFTNPLMQRDGSDPHIVYTDGYYYFTTTTWSDIQVTRATTLGGLKSGERKIVWKDLNRSRCCNMWAPEMHYLDGVWYIYYTAGNSANLDGQRAHVLKGGATPWDSYYYAGQLTSQWGIDGTILRFSEQNYFVWSCMANKLQCLCIAKLNSPSKIGQTYVLSQPTNSWEREGSPVNEGPAAMYHGGKTYLAFSASFCWSPSYQLGLLTWDDKGDPLQSTSWKKTGPLFKSSNGNYGTGHNGFFLSPDNAEIWNVYHATAKPAGACDGNRYTMAQKVNWNIDGTPNFGSAPRLGQSLSGPKGEL